MIPVASVELDVVECDYVMIRNASETRVDNIQRWWNATIIIIIIIIFNLITRWQSDINEIESRAWSMHVTMMHMLGGKEMFLVWI